MPIYVAASGPLAAKLAGRVGDGFICTSGKGADLYSDLLGAVAEGAQAGGHDASQIAQMIEIKVSYERDEARRRARLPVVGRARAVRRGEGGRRGPDGDGAAGRRATPTAPAAASSSPTSPEDVVERIGTYIELGFTELVFHFPGDDQARTSSSSRATSCPCCATASPCGRPDVALARRQLGDSGLEVSLFALGSWRTWEYIPREQAAGVLDHARASGIDLLEVARYNDESGRAPIPSGYSEVVFGEAFRASGWPREEVTIGEKLWWEFWPQQSPSEELDLSLERTGLDHVDFLECDPPPAEIPMEDVVGMLGELIAGGRARAWGIVNWTAERVAEAGRAAKAAGLPAPSSAQLPYSLVARDWVEGGDMTAALDLCGASVMASYVLMGGILSGKYAGGGGEGRMAQRLDDPRMADAVAAVPSLLALAERLGEPPAVLAMAFALSNPRVATILTGATRPEQIDQNLRALEVLEGLGEDDLAALRAIGA